MFINIDRQSYNDQNLALDFLHVTCGSNMAKYKILSDNIWINEYFGYQYCDKSPNSNKCSCQKKSVGGPIYCICFPNNKITQCLNSALQFV